MEGWIKIHRKIQNNWLWQEKRKFSKFEAWMSLLLKANHKENKILIGNKIINIDIGSFITSEIKLADEWNWSRITVRKFLNLLENEKMIKKICTTKYTSVSIENWALYQFEEHQNIQRNIQQDIQQKNIKIYTNKNDKNNKNINNNIKENNKKKNPTLEEINQYILEKQLKVDGQKFYEYFEEGSWKDSKGNQVKNWKQKLLTWNRYADNNTKKQTYEQRNYDNLDFLYKNNIL